MSDSTFTLPNLNSSSCKSPLVCDPQYNPYNIQASEELLTLSHTEVGLALYEYARRSRGSILEIGTYCGHTALFLGFGIRNREKYYSSDQLFTIDTHSGVDGRDLHHTDLSDLLSRDQPATFRRYVQNCKKFGIWSLAYPIIDDSTHAHEQWLFGQNLGLLFIDGDHEHALQDFRNFIPYVQPGGYVCFHDYWPELPQVMKDIDLLVDMGEIEPIERIHTLFIARKPLNGSSTVS